MMLDPVIGEIEEIMSLLETLSHTKRMECVQEMRSTPGLAEMADAVEAWALKKEASK